MIRHSDIRRAHFFTPFLDLLFDGVADFAGLGEFFCGRSGETGRVGEAPVQTRGDAGENRALFGAGFIADGDDVGEGLAGFYEIPDGLGRVGGNIDADFLHRRDNDGVEFAGFEAGAVSFELVATDIIEERFGHLAAGAVVDADEKDLLLHTQLNLTRDGWGATAVFFTHAAAGGDGETSADDRSDDVEPEVFEVEGNDGRSK